ncbi:MAG TPA: CoA-transferase [Acidimicrobiia bacterium]|nr:CoA-transferase [Acidimicrobiia bacterium]
MRDGPPTRAEVCAAAIADCFARDGEILANPIGTLPVIGGRLAKATVAPELVMTDGEALLVENIIPIGVENPDKVVAGWNPYRSMFDVVWSGRRHVMMGGSQFDKWGNQNFAFIGSYDKPRTQLLGMRGAPGNTINDKTSYWVPAHTTRTFVPAVDVVSGVGYDRARDIDGNGGRFHNLGHVITNLCVIDFATPDNRMRLRSVHPGVTVDDVVAATGFELTIDGDVATSRLPTDDELDWIRTRIDPNGLGEDEVPNP